MTVYFRFCLTHNTITSNKNLITSWEYGLANNDKALTNIAMLSKPCLIYQQYMISHLRMGMQSMYGPESITC